MKSILNLGLQPLPELPPCPHCGRIGGAYLNHRVYGWSQSYYDDTGRYQMSDYDGTGSKHSETIRCDECGRIRHDLILSTDDREYQIIIAKQARS